MKADLHHEWYPDARVMCQCGNTWTTGATVPEIRTEICSNCHPFYTGEQRIVDTEGRVDKFMTRLAKRDKMREDAANKNLPQMQMPMSELGIDKRFVTILAENEINTVQDFLDKLAEGGDDLILGYEGIGRKVLADIKRGLRQRGYDLPEAETEA